MPLHCHRCHAELPSTASVSGHLDDGAALFCPRCGAPQILLPEHMRDEVPVAESLGTPAPARTGGGTPMATLPGYVDWRAALTAIAIVAGVGAVLAVAGLQFNAASFFSTVWTMGGAVIALGLYARSRPRAWMDARVGFRIGAATGLLMTGAMGFALAVTGVILRFGSHGLAGFDVETAQDFAAMHQQMALRLQEQSQPAELQQKVLGMMASPEVHGGIALFYFAVAAGFILLLSAGGGAFAGMLRASRSARSGLRRGE
jgi:hypothetical protein